MPIPLSTRTRWPRMHILTRSARRPPIFQDFRWATGAAPRPSIRSRWSIRAEATSLQEASFTSTGLCEAGIRDQGVGLGIRDWGLGVRDQDQKLYRRGQRGYRKAVVMA